MTLACLEQPVLLGVSPLTIPSIKRHVEFVGIGHLHIFSWLFLRIFFRFIKVCFGSGLQVCVTSILPSSQNVFPHHNDKQSHYQFGTVHLKPCFCCFHLVQIKGNKMSQSIVTQGSCPKWRWPYPSHLPICTLPPSSNKPLPRPRPPDLIQMIKSFFFSTHFVPLLLLSGSRRTPSPIDRHAEKITLIAGITSPHVGWPHTRGGGGRAGDGACYA